MALQRVPAANAVWAQDRILRFKHSDIGVAVAIDGGLLTPVIRQAELKSLSAISNEMRDLAARARAKKLKPSEYQGGASAISNLGMYGVREFSAIINPPQATILAVGAARRQAVETEDGGVAFVSVMTVTLSCDHRVVDGALGARAPRRVPEICRAAGDDAGLGARRWPLLEACSGGVKSIPRHSGARRRREPGIHNRRPWLWIPGSLAALGPRDDDRGVGTIDRNSV